MPCYHPITAWHSATPGVGLTFKRRDSTGQVQKLPCGQCRGCRLERSRQWAMRCVHEASLYDNNCFITLTYNPESLPADQSLNKKHFQDFMKRLRKKYPDSPIRYYHCGEYGEDLGRPHYHACLFNFDFEDKVFFKKINDLPVYTSEILEKVWQKKGFCLIGTVTFESAAYVARYIMKKVNGPRQAEHYERIDQDTGEIFFLQPEYTTMSRRPGIAKEWYSQFKTDVFPDDFVVLRGKTMKPPRYYDSIYRIEDPEEYEKLKESRKKQFKKHAWNNTPDRLAVREKCQMARTKLLKRNYEDGTEDVHNS